MGRRVALVAALALAAGACTGGTPPPAPSPPLRTATPTPTRESPRGGEITIGVEQWAECLNPILACAQPITYQTVLHHVLPRAMEVAPDGSLVASPMLVEAPTLGNGGLTQAPFTVTYRIRPEAVWDDGSPITSEDFAFTWRAILHTSDSALAEEYERIRAVDTPDAGTAVLRFDDRWAGWPELFGGSKGFVLKAAAFPDADPDAPNLHGQMLFDIPFSGGPFGLAEWKPTEYLAAPTKDRARAVLERNERYFGPLAPLDTVTFVPLLGPKVEYQAMWEGTVDVIAPSATGYATFSPGTSPLDVAPEIFDARGGDGTRFEALWFNAHERPLNNPLVREALMHAIDRRKVIDELVHLFSGSHEVLNCGFLAVPEFGWCRSRPFVRFPYHPATSIRLLEQAGYDCSRPPCRKKGKPLEVEYLTDPTNPLETRTQEILIKSAVAAGFNLKVVNFEAGVLFGAGSSCPFSHIAITGCSVIVPPNGSVTEWLGCNSIPRKRNGYIGKNRIAWCNREADALMRESDRQIDPVERQALLDRAYELEAEDMIGLPLYVVPAIVVWRVEDVAGPIDRYLSSPYGAFFNISEWYRAVP